MVFIVILFVFLGAFFVSYATFQLICEFTGVPTHKTSKIMLQAVYPKVGFMLFLDVALTSISKTLVNLLKLSLKENQKLVITLEVAEIRVKQEVYLLRPFVSFVLLFVGALPLLRIHIILFLLGVVLSAAVSLYSFGYAYTLANKYRDAIETELPSFIQIAAQCYKNGIECSQFLKIYQPIAGKEMQKEIEYVLDSNTIVKKAWEHMRERVNLKNFYPVHEAFTADKDKAYTFLTSFSFQLDQKLYKDIKSRFHSKLFLSKLVLFLYLLFSCAGFTFYISKTLL